MAPKLHEVLAVDQKVKAQAATIVGETHKEFSDRSTHFTGQQIVFHPDQEGAQEIPEGGHEMASTVRQRLDYTFKHINRMMDTDYQIEATNQNARANVIIGGQTIIADAPATWLLHCEKRLTEIISLLKKAPSLDVTKKWEQIDGPLGVVYKADPEVRIRHRKQARPITMAEATEHHPAQTQLINEDVAIGRVVGTLISGELTSANKAEMIDRTEQLLRAIKKARAKANNVEIPSRPKVGKALSNFILDGEVDGQEVTDDD